ncbi:MAG: MBL fold metallo-hydrolase [Gammaproteobacteria bacterium]|nr:MBL fold metallo-hydrolase [Gammaproteobacteria bacterium]
MSYKRILYFILLLTSISTTVSCVTPAAYQGPISDHYDGEVFYNQLPLKSHGFGDFLSWMSNREPGSWQEYTEAEYGPKPPARGNSLNATFINHSTVLLQTTDFNIITDPIWSERASPVSWAGPKRVRPPGIRFDDLPVIDIVLISHNHYDHMDLPTLKRLQEKFDPLFIVGLGNSSILHDEGITRVKELDWWESLPLSETTVINGVPAQHFSMRWIGDRNQRLWMGYVIQAPEGNIFFAGDTGMGPHFKQIYQRYGAMRLSLLPIGAYKPRWFMAGVHVSPAESLLAHQQLHSDYSIGIHFGTFQLADDAQDDPLRELELERSKLSISKERFWVLGFGEGRKIPESDSMTALK